MLAFASEIDALMASGLVTQELDPETLAHMLRQGYVPPGQSIWRAVESLGPASRLRWSASRPAQVDRWWTPPAVEDDPGRDAAAEWFRHELTRSVDEQLEADVAVGAFLSGGIDSSTIAALAGQRRPGLEAFAFDMPGSSEVDHARAVANRHQMKLRVYTPEFAPGELADALVQMAGVWDEPFGDSSALPTWLLSRFAREYVTVALTGDGADELLGGYLYWARQCLEPDDPARAATSDGFSRRRWRHWLRRGDGPAPDGVARRYARFRQYLDAPSLAAMGLPAVDLGPIDFERYTNGTADDISRFDLDHYLPGDILVKTDRASMAHGLEVRSPFLDVQLAEGCLRLPSNRKVDADTEKILLRDAFGHLLPDEVVTRPKQGFGAPMQAWLADPAVRELTAAHLQDRRSAFFDIVDFDGVQPHVERHDQATWNLLAAALWWSEHQATGPT
jgi:asparagine synthase (glutamine-hydrolysing)